MNSLSRRIPVELESQPYEVVLGGEGLKGIGSELLNSGVRSGIKILIVSNHDVAKPYGDLLVESLNEMGFETNVLIIEAGEDKKTLATIEEIHNAAFNARLERGSLMIAFGGGVVGDMTGFAAATWLRGISVAQVPTTLLAMVDAAIGGKTGVNHPGGKNLIGAFHQPKIVLIDPVTLRTLPSREFRAGMAEVIKYGLIGDRKLFSLLENLSDISTLDVIPSHILEDLLERSVKAKAGIVSRDERESGLRAILNYGHTFGHVVESLCGYGTWLHGEAVSIGMVAIGQLALQLGKWSYEDANRQKKLLQKAGLPTQWPDLDPDLVLSSLKGDKKVKDEKIRFVMPTRIGNVEIVENVDNSQIRECLSSLL